MFKITFIFRSIIFLALISVISCGSGTSTKNADIPANDPVGYDNDILIVNGIDYVRTAKDERYFKKGEVFITYEVSRQDDVFALFESYDLEVLNSTTGSSATVGVPDGFEEQWIEALKVEELINSAETNSIIRAPA